MIGTRSWTVVGERFLELGIFTLFLSYFINSMQLQISRGYDNSIDCIQGEVNSNKTKQTAKINGMDSSSRIDWQL